MRILQCSSTKTPEASNDLGLDIIERSSKDEKTEHPGWHFGL